MWAIVESTYEDRDYSETVNVAPNMVRRFWIRHDSEEDNYMLVVQLIGDETGSVIFQGTNVECVIVPPAKALPLLRMLTGFLLFREVSRFIEIGNPTLSTMGASRP